MKNFRILVDLDEVLTDFVGAAAEVHRVDRLELEALRRENGWGMELPLSILLRRDIDVNEFWEPINYQGSIFWETLYPLPWFNEVINLVTSLTDDWFIVTGPSNCPTSYDGKVKYMKRVFGSTFDRFIISPHKHLLAKPGVMLIDDREENVEKFVAAGGDGIVFPSNGNKLHRFATNPVPYVASILKEKFNV